MPKLSERYSLSLINAPGGYEANSEFDAKRKVLPMGSKQRHQLSTAQPPATWTVQRVGPEALHLPRPSDC